MKIILSPAKALKQEVKSKITDTNQPAFLEQSEKLIKKLQKFSRKKIGNLMSISSDLSELNYQRYHNWQLPFVEGNAIPAIYIFNGDAYRGLDAESLTKTEINRAQKQLRMLSGLYGILKPKDLIMPYRLEMGTRLQTSTKKTNLYHFWGNQLTLALQAEMKKDEPLVNVASKEYFKVLDFKLLDRPVITCHFKENKNGVYKAIMTFAKQARGKMTRFIIKNKIEKIEELKAFDIDGYLFNNKLSTESDFVFTRG